MGSQRSKIAAVVVIILLIVLLVVLRVAVGLSESFYLVLGADVAAILAILIWMFLQYRSEIVIQKKLLSFGRELRTDYSFLRKVAGVPTKFRYRDLEIATDNFRALIGRGASGTVFKGILDDGTPVAVKRLEGVEHAEKEFKAEVFFCYTIATGGCLTSLLKPSKMSYSSPAMGSGSRSSGGRAFEFGRTHVVRPKGKHQATIVWLHGLGDNGSSWSQLLESLPLPNVKWICPTAPTRPVAIFGGFPCTAFKVGIGGFSMGAAIALYSATCCAQGKYGKGNPYSINLSVVVALSGWLPCSRSLRNRIEGSHEAMRRAASFPILQCHGKGDDVIQYEHGEKSARVLSATGFRNLTFRTYNGLGHYTIPQEMEEVGTWLSSRLGLEGSRF